MTAEEDLGNGLYVTLYDHGHPIQSVRLENPDGPINFPPMHVPYTVTEVRLTDADGKQVTGSRFESSRVVGSGDTFHVTLNFDVGTVEWLRSQYSGLS